ncbi:MAG: ATP-binding cassette domain-containing protein [Proteobacteria bacterium]|nr:ATP-binding cassette domain-containing protein [Pseudomonadota bacterium]
MIDLQHYHRLIRKLQPSRALRLQAFFAMLVTAATLALLPMLVKNMLDGAFILRDSSQIQTTSLMLIGLFLVRGIASYINLRATGKASGQLGADLRMDFFNKLLTLPAGYYTHYNPQQTGMLITHINTIAQTATGNIALFMQDGLTIIALMLCALHFNQEFAILLLLITPLIVLIHRAGPNRFNKPGAKSLQATNDLIEHLSQSVAHFRKIRLDGGQRHESQRLGKISATIAQADAQQTHTKAMMIPFDQVISALIVIAVTYTMALHTINGTLSLPETAALITIALLLIRPVRRIANLPKQLEHDQTALEAIFAFLDQPSEQDSGTISIAHGNGKLAFEHVRCDNDAHTQTILHHLHFTLHPREVVVFTGYSAAEKNLLIDLILRLRQPTSGRILFDDHPLPDIRLSHLHASIALVSSDTFLLDDKIAGNIAYGALHCSDEAKITSAAQMSHASGFIRHMPDGFQTTIGPDGTAITPEQLQQIAIARAFVKNSPLLILDEPFSQQELAAGNLLATFEALMQNRTTLIFNPSIPPLQRIDRIFVLENGCITETTFP